MDKFKASVAPLTPMPTTEKHSVVAELPAAYGRSLPISEEEIAIINVSILEPPKHVLVIPHFPAAGRSKMTAS